MFNLAVAVLIAVALPPTRPLPHEHKRPPQLSMRDPRVFPHLAFLFVYFVAVGMIQQTIGWFIADRYEFTDTVSILIPETAAAYASPQPGATLPLTRPTVTWG